MTIRVWLKLQTWRNLWRFEREVNIPHLSVNVMCPWFSIRVLWYHCTQEFKAWPNHFETGIVIGWRCPFANKLRKKAWLRKEEIPLALYGTMDLAYVAHATKELGWGDDAAQNPGAYLQHSPYIAATVREIRGSRFACDHNYWIADCQNCARAALTLAVLMTEKVKPQSVPYANESPIAAFQRREAEAQRRLAAGEPL